MDKRQAVENLFNQVTGTWEKYEGNPILSPSNEQDWDVITAHGGTVTKIGDFYWMYYSGWDAPEFKYSMQAGVAISHDGKYWRKYDGNPIVKKGTDLESWDFAVDSVETILKEGEQYRMWYSGSTRKSFYRIGHAVSSDGLHWIRDPRNPILTEGKSGTWDSKSVFANTIIKEGKDYRMWYSGLDETWQIGLATSEDGIAWRKHSKHPVLSRGEDQDWDNILAYHCWVIRIKGGYAMWYAGASREDRKQKIGLAVSENGIHWVKYDHNPVLVPEVKWEKIMIWAPHVLKIGNDLVMYYSGNDGTYMYTGMATLQR